jgi:phosphoglycolate phosphatase
MAKISAFCIFDLDGTLVNSLRDIAEALNECLELLGLPTHPVDRYRYMVGEGVPLLCRRAVGRSHPRLVERLIELARPRYRVRPLVHTKPYPGVEELIRALRDAGATLAVLSNKPHDMTVRIVRTFWPDSAFRHIQGYTEERYRKPDPFYIADMQRQFALDPGRMVLVGDTPTDIETARRAQIRSIGVTWGFRTRDDLAEAGAQCIVDTPEQVREIILGGDRP